MSLSDWPAYGLNASLNEVETDGGMIVGPDQLVADAGAAALRSGGNAVDAAVAAAFAAAVVEPSSNGLGGSATITVALRDPERVAVVEGHMVSPGGVRPEHYPLAPPGEPSELIEQVFGLASVVGQANLYGAKAVTTPGAVACLLTAQERYGRLPRKDVLAPAIALAAAGFHVNYLTSAYIAGVAPGLARDPGLAELFVPGGFPLRGPGASEPDRLVQPALARTLELIATEGSGAFYRGVIAQTIVERVRRDGGMLSLEDLDSYRPTVLESPLEARYQGLTLIGAPRAGLPTILEALYVHEFLDLGGSVTDQAVAWARAFRLAFTDRARYLTHNPLFDVPWEGISSPAYARARLEAEAAGTEPPHPGAFSSEGVERPSGRAAHDTSDHTCHVTAVDREGNVAGVTATLLNAFGSRIMDAASGVVLNGGMAYFDPRPGAINSIAPGVPVMSAMTPLVLADDRRGPFAGLGASGGRMIISGLAQIVEAVARRDLGLQEAIEEPRIHAESSTVMLDARWPLQAADALAEAGFEVVATPEGPTTGNFARPSGILIGNDGLRRSGVDPKKPVGIAIE